MSSVHRLRRHFWLHKSDDEAGWFFSFLYKSILFTLILFCTLLIYKDCLKDLSVKHSDVDKLIFFPKLVRTMKLLFKFLERKQLQSTKNLLNPSPSTTISQHCGCYLRPFNPPEVWKLCPASTYTSVFLSRFPVTLSILVRVLASLSSNVLKV